GRLRRAAQRRVDAHLPPRRRTPARVATRRTEEARGCSAHAGDAHLSGDDRGRRVVARLPRERGGELHRHPTRLTAPAAYVGGMTTVLLQRGATDPDRKLITDAFPDVEIIEIDGPPPADVRADVFFGGYMDWDNLIRWIDATGVRWVQLSGTGIDKVPRAVF